MLWLLFMVIFVRYQRRAAARAAYELGMIEGQRSVVYGMPIRERESLPTAQGVVKAVVEKT